MPPDGSESSAKQFLAFTEAVRRESDRGCVICSAAYIDDALESAIRSYLKELSNPPKSLLDSLLTRRPQPPIGSFAVRTKMARALGLIDDPQMTAIDGLRPMRNDAAHLGSEFSFDNPLYRIEQMYVALSDEEQESLRTMDSLREKEPEKYPKRRAFEAAVTSIFFRLLLMSDNPMFWSQILKIPGADVRRMDPRSDPHKSLAYFTDSTPITPEWLEEIGFQRVSQSSKRPSSDESTSQAQT